jgi:hypothetical protein
MIGIAIVTGALVVLVVVMRIFARWTSRSIGLTGQLGPVSRHWLEVHRAEDK